MILCLTALVASIWWSEGSAPRADSGPRIWAVAWSAVPARVNNLREMVRIEPRFTPRAGEASYDPTDLIRRLKALPAGRRAVMWWRYADCLWGLRDDELVTDKGERYASPWADAGIAEVAREWPRTLALLKHAGAEMDILVGDCERWGSFTSWNLKEPQLMAIMADPRFARSQFGVPSLRDLMPRCSVPGVRYGEAKYDWNLHIGRLAAAQMNEAIWKPAVQQFPNLIGSNYEGYRSIDRPAPDYNGHHQPHDNVVGNAASPALYGAIEQANWSAFIDPKDPSRLAREGTTRLPVGPWQSFLMCHQQARACVRDASGARFAPWIASLAYDGDVADTVGFPKDPRCYDENVRQVAVLGSVVLLYWNPPMMPRPGSKDVVVRDPAVIDRRLDALLDEINQHTQGPTSGPLTLEPISFLADHVLSGAKRADGKYIWRLSVSPKVRSAIDRASGRTYEFGPDAPLGCWIETETPNPPPIDVVTTLVPVATSPP